MNMYENVKFSFTELMAREGNPAFDVEKSKTEIGKGGACG